MFVNINTIKGIKNTHENVVTLKLMTLNDFVYQSTLQLMNAPSGS